MRHWMSWSSTSCARLTREGGFSADDASKLKENLDQQKAIEVFWDSRIASYEAAVLKNPAKAGQLSAQALKAEEDKETTLARLRAEAQTLRIPVVIREFMECKGDRDAIAAKWEAKTPDAKRATLKGLTKAIRHARSPLTKAQALRLPEDERRQVARAQVSVEWGEEFKQAGDVATVTETGVVAILEVPEGHKLCGGECREAKPADAEHFYRDKGRADGWSNLCKPCYRARQRGYKAARARPGTSGPGLSL